MGMRTAIMLYISGKEFESKRIQEVNKFKNSLGNSIDLISVSELPYPNIFPLFLYVGRYKSLELDAFIAHVETQVNWEYPEYVRIIVKDDHEPTLRVYSLEHKRWLE